MAESVPGSIVALIGGILGIIGAVMLIAGGGIIKLIIPARLGAIATIYLILGIVYLIFSVLTIIGAVWMKKAETCRKGGIVALVFGILSLNILAIVGGALGIAASRK